MAEDRDDELIGDEAGEIAPGTFDDPSGSLPPKNYWYESTLNKGWRGANNKKLAYTGVTGKNLAIAAPELPTQATKSDINVTPSGHVIEYNDTPAGERILIKHRTGSGIDMLPDGSIGISVGKTHIMTIRDDMTIIVNGNASYDFKGDVDFKVGGNFNVSALNMNVNLKGNLTETIKGNHRETVTKNKGTIVQQNKSETVIGSNTTTTLGNTTNITKGTVKVAGEGIVSIHSGNVLYMTGKNSTDISSKSANIAADNLLLMGSTGTIGGEGVVMYGKGATFGEGVTAPTFHGDLDGTAALAVQADVTNSQNYADPDPGGGTGSASGYSVTNTATPTTVLPTEEVLDNYLNVGGRGVINVSIEKGELLRVFDKYAETGGLSHTDLTTEEIRSRMRDPYNRENTDFVANAVSAGKLNSRYATATPPGIGRIAAQSGTQRRGAIRVGNRGTSNFGDFTPSGIPANKRFVPDLNYAILDVDDISSSTKIAPDIPVSTFLSGSGEIANFNTTPRADRALIARNLQANAYAMKWVNNNRTSGPFADYTLTVVEGYYVPGPGEVNELGDIKGLAAEGRAVVYELINNISGQADNRKTFELAVYLKDVIQYDKLILDYDDYALDGSINAQIIITVPDIDETYTATFAREIETRFNNNVQSNSDFVEVEFPSATAEQASRESAATVSAAATNAPATQPTPPVTSPAVAAELAQPGAVPSAAVTPTVEETPEVEITQTGQQTAPPDSAPEASSASTPSVTSTPAPPAQASDDPFANRTREEVQAARAASVAAAEAQRKDDEEFLASSAEEKNKRLLKQMLRRLFPKEDFANRGIQQIKSRLDPNGSYKAVEDPGDPGPDGPYWRIVKG